MRQLARLKIQLNKTSAKDQHLINYLTPRSFDDCLNAVSAIAGLHQNQEDINIFRVPSYALRIGHHLHKCAEIKRGLCIRDQNEIMLTDANQFIELFIPLYKSGEKNNIKILKIIDQYQFCNFSLKS